MTDSEKRDETAEPMLLNNEQVCPPDLHPCKTIGEISKFSLWPIVGMMFHPIYSVVNAAVVGRMETKYLAALGLGSLTTGICLISICTSFALVTGTFVAPAHGKGDVNLARMYLHRQYLLNCFVYLVTLIPIMFVKQIYLAIGQDEEIATLASQYVWYIAPCVLPYVQAVTAMGYAEAQKYTFANMFVLSISSVIHVALIALFVSALDMGWEGVCLATSIQFLLRFVIAQIYLCFIKPFKESSSVKLCSRETSSNLGPQFKRGVMSLFMGVWGWWAFDIFTLIASYLATDIISAQTIMRSLGLLTFMIPVGFSKACAYYIGVFIGQGCEKSIKHYYNIAMLLACICGACQIALLWGLEEQVISMYTNKEPVKEQMREAWYVFLIFVFFDTTQGIGSSAIRASGKQRTGALVTGLAYWAIGIPITCMLVFWQTFGIRGIWVGPTAACIFNTLCYQVIVKLTDWKTLIQEAEIARNVAKKVEEDQPSAKASGDDEFQKVSNKLV